MGVLVPVCMCLSVWTVCLATLVEMLWGRLSTATAHFVLSLHLPQAVSEGSAAMQS